MGQQESRRAAGPGSKLGIRSIRGLMKLPVLTSASRFCKNFSACLCCVVSALSRNGLPIIQRRKSPSELPASSAAFPVGIARPWDSLSQALFRSWYTVAGK